LSIFLCFALAAGAELIYATRFYDGQRGLLSDVLTEFNADPESLDRPAVAAALDRARAHFDKGKRFAMMLSNHNAVKYMDEKYTALNELTRLNQKSDAYVALTTSISYIDELKRENYPLLPNLL
jgi:hypothetical protein